MNWPLLLDWAIPSVVGFVFGYLTCMLVGRAVQDEDSPSPRAQRRSQLARTIFGVLLVVLAIATFVDSQQATACFRGALDKRDSISTQQIEDQIALLTADPGQSPPARRAILDRYVETLREQLRVRAENPLECR